MKIHRTWNTLGLLLVAHAISGCGEDDGAKAPAKDAGEVNDAASPNDAGVDGASGDAGADAATPEPGNCAPDKGPTLDQLVQQGKAVEVKKVRLLRQTFVVRDDLYFIEDGVGLSRIKGGSDQSEVLLARTGTETLSYAKVVGDTLYYQDTVGALARVPLATPTATPELQVGTARGYPAVIQGDALYGYDDVRADKHELWRQDFKSGVVTVIASVSEEFGGIDISGDLALFTDNTFGVETLFRVPLAGGKPVKLSPRTHFHIQGVKVLDGAAYFADGYRLWRTDFVASDASMATQPFGLFGPTRSFSQGTREGYGLTERGDRIYWVDDEGTVGWTSKDRATCGSLATISFPDAVNGIGTSVVYASDSFGLYRITL
jgi:hypothetical protein